MLNREQALQDPSLPFLEFEDILATIGEKLPIHVSDSLYAILSAPNALPDGSQVSKHIRLCHGSMCVLCVLYGVCVVCAVFVRVGGACRFVGVGHVPFARIS